MDNYCFCYYHSFIHSGYFHNASSSLPLLRGATDTARILCRTFTPMRQRKLRVKDLPKVLTWRPEQDSNPLPFRRKATNLPMSHHAPQLSSLLLLLLAYYYRCQHCLQLRCVKHELEQL